MDPNATLRELRLLAEQQIATGDIENDHFAELFQAIDQWLTAGGFLPGDWQNAGNARGTIIGMPIEPIQDDDDEADNPDLTDPDFYDQLGGEG